MIFNITCETAFLCAKSYSNDCNNNSCKGNNNEMSTFMLYSQITAASVDCRIVTASVVSFHCFILAPTSDIRWIVKFKMLTVKSRVLTLQDQSKLMHRASPVRYRTITLAQRQFELTDSTENILFIRSKEPPNDL